MCLLIWEYIFTKIKKSSTLRFQQARWGCRRWRHSWRKHLSPRPPPRPRHLPLARGRVTSWSRTLGRWCTLVSLKIQYPVLAVTLLTSLTPTQARKLGFTDKKFNSNTVFYPKKKNTLYWKYHHNLFYKTIEQRKYNNNSISTVQFRKFKTIF